MKLHIKTTQLTPIAELDHPIHIPCHHGYNQGLYPPILPATDSTRVNTIPMDHILDHSLRLQCLRGWHDHTLGRLSATECILVAKQSDVA